MLHEAASLPDPSRFSDDESKRWLGNGEQAVLKPGGKRKRAARGKNGHASSAQVKTFVLDTNVLLHDPACLHRFEDNEVCIPVDVLGELDRFKGEPSERGANAREVHRTLSKFFGQPGVDVMEGVATAGGGRVKLVV